MIIYERNFCPSSVQFVILSKICPILYTMITFEPIIIPNNKRSDGTYPVKIRVYFNGKSRRLPTTWVCHPSDITRTKRKSIKIKKDAGVRDKAKELIDRMRAIVGNYTMMDLEGKDVDWLVKKIKEGLADKKFQLDFLNGRISISCARLKEQGRDISEH